MYVHIDVQWLRPGEEWVIIGYKQMRKNGWNEK